MTNRKQIGIWLDFKEAVLVTIDPAQSKTPEVKKVQSNIDWGVPKGGSRSKAPWGPHMAVNEKAFLARRKKEEKTYFETILSALEPDTDALMIFGPAEAKLGLEKLIQKNKRLQQRLKAVQTADSMTQNQIVATVRDYFAAN